MPDYVFLKEGDPSQHTIRYYHMNEAPSIGSLITDPDGTQWRRAATKPRASIDTKMDPYSSKDFVKATNKKGTMGDLWDRSKEASLKRADKEGIDPVKRSFYDDYAKKRKGKRHPQELKEKTSQQLKGTGIKVEWGED
jgi:hypothetical protein